MKKFIVFVAFAALCSCSLIDDITGDDPNTHIISKGNYKFQLDTTIVEQTIKNGAGIITEKWIYATEISGKKVSKEEFMTTMPGHVFGFSTYEITGNHSVNKEQTVRRPVYGFSFFDDLCVVYYLIPMKFMVCEYRVENSYIIFPHMFGDLPEAEIMPWKCQLIEIIDGKLVMIDKHLYEEHDLGINTPALSICSPLTDDDLTKTIYDAYRNAIENDEVVRFRD